MIYVDVIVKDFEEIPKMSFPGKEGVSNASLGDPTGEGSRGGGVRQILDGCR